MGVLVKVYLAIGIISRAVFFIYERRKRKRYNIQSDYKPFSWPVELFAHALDVIGWPFSTVASFYLFNKKVKEAKGE